MLLLLSAVAMGGALDEDWTCAPLGDMPGPEDFDVVTDEAGAWLLASADARREGEPAGRDGYYAVDPTTNSSRKLDITGRDACSLHPHGVSTVQDAEGAWWLYAVLHYTAEDGTNPACALTPGPEGPIFDGVERYALTPEGLRFDARLSDPLMRNPNDVDATADGRLVLSDNPDWQGGEMASDLLLRRAKGRVLGYAPETGWRVAAEPMLYANGVLLDDHGALLVATFWGNLFVFESQDGVWIPSQHLRLRGALDNFLVDDQGVTWLAGHPSLRRFAKHAKDGAEPSPADAWALVRGPEGYAVQQRLETRGEVAAAASSVLRVGDRIVLAQVFNDGLVACTPN